jgi:hypothetical protein
MEAIWPVAPESPAAMEVGDVQDGPRAAAAMYDNVGAMGRRGKVCGSTVKTGCVFAKTVAELLLHTH